MTKFFNYVLLLDCLILFGQTEENNERWSINKNSSEIVYHGKHLLHQWSGINNNVLGLVLLDPQSEEIKKIAIVAHVKDFNSGNSNRDSHSLEVLNALNFPETNFFSDTIETKNDSIVFDGMIEFHGQNIEKKIIALIKRKDKKITFIGAFEISLSEFEIAPPAFMLVEVNDIIDVSFSLEFKK